MEQMCIMLVINMLKEEHTFGRPFAVCLHVFTVYPHLKIRIVPTCQELWIKEVGTKYTESPSITVGARRHLIDH